jgi:hypothetical protein
MAMASSLFAPPLAWAAPATASMAATANANDLVDEFFTI